MKLKFLTKKNFIINLILLSTKQYLCQQSVKNIYYHSCMQEENFKKYVKNEKYWAQINDCFGHFLCRWHPDIAELERFK